MITPELYQAAQNSIGKRIKARMVRAMVKYGIPVSVAQRRQFATRVYPAVQNARAASYDLAVQYMEFSADQAGVDVPEPAPIAQYEPRAIVTVLDRIVDPVVVSVEIEDEDSSTTTVDVEQVASNFAAAIERHAQQAGRDVIRQTAEMQGEQTGWARVLTGPGDCAFCAMLASRGPVYDSEHAALFQGMSMNGYHDNCDCRAVLVFEGQDWDGREDYERLEALWSSSTRGKSQKAARKAFAKALAEAERTAAGRGTVDRSHNQTSPRKAP